MGMKDGIVGTQSNGMGNDQFVDFPAGCWLWVYTQPLQRFSSHLVIEENEIYTFTSNGKKQVLPFFGCCTADSQTDAGRYQLFNNGSLVLFSTACKHKMGVRTATSQGWGGPALQYRQSRAEAE